MINHYATLGLPQTATPEEIKRAYHRLARKVHPDVNPAGAAQFVALTAAQEVLCDAARRRVYDAELEHWLKSAGALACPHCGTANRVPPFRPGQKPVCGACQTDLPVTETQRRAVVREALITQAVRVADDLGGDVLSLAHDALRLGLGRLRQRWGLARVTEAPHRTKR